MSSIFTLKRATVSFLCVFFAAPMLMMSISSAQVNGSGPSDPALFDEVITFPGASTTFASPFNVGGVPGETVQLNLNDASAFSENATFTASSGAEVNINSGFVGVPSSGPSNSSSSGGEINLLGGTLGTGFSVQDSELNIAGGTLLLDATATGSVVNVSDGFVDVSFTATDSVVNVSGNGNIDVGFNAIGSVVNISGGEVLPATIEADSVVNLTGGVLFADTLIEDSVLNVSGGSVDFAEQFGGFFLQVVGSDLNVFGSDFAIDGNLVDLTSDDPFTITDRDVTLSGLLLDGSAFSYELGSANDFTSNVFIDSNSSVTVSTALPSTIPEPSSWLLIASIALIGTTIRRRQ